MKSILDKINKNKRSGVAGRVSCSFRNSCSRIRTFEDGGSISEHSRSKKSGRSDEQLLLLLGEDGMEEDREEMFEGDEDFLEDNKEVSEDEEDRKLCTRSYGKGGAEKIVGMAVLWRLV